MSSKLDLAIKEFDPTKKGEFIGNEYKQDMFLQLYIEKLYGDQLHYLKFTQIVVLFVKEMVDYNFVKGPMQKNHYYPLLFIIII